MTDSLANPSVLPPNDMLIDLSIVHIRWAQIDFFATQALSAMLNLTGAETAVLLGKLDAIAKIQKCKGILLARDQHQIAKTAHDIASHLDKQKPLRNAVTHGLYQGATEDQQLLYILIGSIVDFDDEVFMELFVVNRKSLSAHLDVLDWAVNKLLTLTAHVAPHAEFSLQARVRSYPPEEPPPGIDPNTPRILPRPSPR